MERYIDASKIKLTGLTFEDINNEVYFSLSDVRKAIEQTPTADVVEVRHGEWGASDKYFSYYQYKCSNCGCDDYTQTGRNGQCKLMRYCPNCGAKMDGTPKERGGEK